jgi:type IV pilus assembly protein PilV
MRAKRRTTQRARESGFTMLEVVIAMAILASGLLAIAAAQLAALHMSSKSRSLMDAIHLAQAQMEAFHATPQASLPASGNDANNPIDRDGNALDPAATDQTQFNRSWTVEPNVPITGLTRVTVNVTWFDSKVGLVRTTSLQSMKGN